MVGMIAVTACKKDEEDPDGPNLTITPDKTTAWQGDTITFTYSVSSNATLEKLSWTTSALNTVPAGEVALSGNSVNNQEIQIILPTTGITAGSLIFTFDAVDKDGPNYADSKNITITLVEPEPDEPENTELSDYSANIILSNQSWATYNGAPRTGQESETIGVRYVGADVGIINITKTDNCSGWVIIDNISNVEYYEDIVEIYDNGTVITQLTLQVNDQGKAYQEKHFVSKIGSDYILVHYKDGIRNTTTGNVAVFAYKSAEE